MPIEEDRATVTQNQHNRFEDQSCGSGDICADKQTHTERHADRHDYHNTPLPYHGRVINPIVIKPEPENLHY